MISRKVLASLSGVKAVIRMLVILKMVRRWVLVLIPRPMVISMLASGTMMIRKVMELIHLQAVATLMKASGRMVLCKDRAPSSGKKMVINTSAAGRMIRSMAMEHSHGVSAATCMPETGRMTSNMEKVPKHGPMVTPTPVIIKKINNQVAEPRFGRAVTSTLETGKKINRMETAPIPGPMEMYMLVII